MSRRRPHVAAVVIWGAAFAAAAPQSLWRGRRQRRRGVRVRASVAPFVEIACRTALGGRRRASGGRTGERRSQRERDGPQRREARWRAEEETARRGGDQ